MSRLRLVTAGVVFLGLLAVGVWAPLPMMAGCSVVCTLIALRGALK